MDPILPWAGVARGEGGSTGGQRGTHLGRDVVKFGKAHRALDADRALASGGQAVGRRARGGAGGGVGGGPARHALTSPLARHWRQGEAETLALPAS